MKFIQKSNNNNNNMDTIRLNDTLYTKSNTKYEPKYKIKYNSKDENVQTSCCFDLNSSPPPASVSHSLSSGGSGGTSIPNKQESQKQSKCPIFNGDLSQNRNNNQKFDLTVKYDKTDANNYNNKLKQLSCVLLLLLALSLSVNVMIIIDQLFFFPLYSKTLATYRSSNLSQFDDYDVFPLYYNKSNACTNRDTFIGEHDSHVNGSNQINIGIIGSVFQPNDGSSYTLTFDSSLYSTSEASTYDILELFGNKHTALCCRGFVHWANIYNLNKNESECRHYTLFDFIESSLDVLNNTKNINIFFIANNLFYPVAGEFKKNELRHEYDMYTNHIHDRISSVSLNSNNIGKMIVQGENSLDNNDSHKCQNSIHINSYGVFVFGTQYMIDRGCNSILAIVRWTNYMYTESGCVRASIVNAPSIMGASVGAHLLNINPNLTVRDLQYIIINSSDSSYDPESSTNMAGITHSNYHGFGVLNLTQAIDIARTWKSLGIANMYIPSSQSIIQNTSMANLTLYKFKFENLNDTIVDEVIVKINMTYSVRDISVYIESPSQLNTLLYNSKFKYASSTMVYSRTLKYFGEQITGEWTIYVYILDNLECIKNNKLFNIDMKIYGGKSAYNEN